MSRRHLILTFHGLGDPPPSVQGSERTVWVDRDLFVATVDEAARQREAVSITFDDGNRSDVEIAVPELERRKLEAIFFIVADRLGQPGYLDAGDLREMARAGMRIGSHGLEHRSWRTLDDDLLETHLREARSIIEDAAGVPVTAASCPFGEYDRRVLRHLRETGHERVYTSDGGPAKPGAWLQARNTIHSDWGPAAARVAERRNGLVRAAKLVAKRWR